ncbi:hypothetical protein [Streptomyces sp. NPDC048425]|uniref:hypothetical protein n=1 Tax=Streptomyces sp. NPDC048425 TaxID=3365548 RepID=UPI0037231337
MADDTQLSIEELEAALPSVTQWRVAAGRSVGWTAFEVGPGTALPSDYRSLVVA